MVSLGLLNNRKLSQLKGRIHGDATVTAFKIPCSVPIYEVVWKLHVDDANIIKLKTNWSNTIFCQAPNRVKWPKGEQRIINK